MTRISMLLLLVITSVQLQAQTLSAQKQENVNKITGTWKLVYSKPNNYYIADYESNKFTPGRILNNMLSKSDAAAVKNYISESESELQKDVQYFEFKNDWKFLFHSNGIVKGGTYAFGKQITLNAANIEFFFYDQSHEFMDCSVVFDSRQGTPMLYLNSTIRRPEISFLYLEAGDDPTYATLDERYRKINANELAVLQTKEQPLIDKIIKENGSNGVQEEVKVEKGIRVEEADYPGGRAAWIRYLGESIKLENLNVNGAQPGKYRVYVSFTVNKDGSITDVKAENDPGFGMANEAVRVVKNSGRWNPKEEDGQKVTSKCTRVLPFEIAD